MGLFEREGVYWETCDPNRGVNAYPALDSPPSLLFSIFSPLSVEFPRKTENQRRKTENQRRKIENQSGIFKKTVPNREKPRKAEKSREKPRKVEKTHPNSSESNPTHTEPVRIFTITSELIRIRPNSIRIQHASVRLRKTASETNRTRPNQSESVRISPNLIIKIIYKQII